VQDNEQPNGVEPVMEPTPTPEPQSAPPLDPAVIPEVHPTDTPEASPEQPQADVALAEDPFAPAPAEVADAPTEPAVEPAVEPEPEVELAAEEPAAENPAEDTAAEPEPETPEETAAAAEPTLEPAEKDPNEVSVWPFVAYAGVWVVFAAATVWQLLQTPAGVAVVDSPAYRVVLAVGLALEVAGPLVILASWLSAWGRPGSTKSGLLLSALLKGAIVMFFGSTLWWIALMILDQLRLGRVL
jgi:hypothetical protein